MSGPAPLPRGDASAPAQKRRGRRSDISQPPAAPAAVLDQRLGAATVKLTSETEGSDSDHVTNPVNAPEEECSLDLLRIVKYKPSVIVFRDHDNQATSASEASDTRESSPSTPEEGASRHGEDAFPETLQFKELQVSRRCRNLNRNRKLLRKRPDARPKNVPLDSRNPSSEGKCVFTGSQEQQDALSNNGKQRVRESVALSEFGTECVLLVAMCWRFSEHFHNSV